jgi:hypothetical protein
MTHTRVSTSRVVSLEEYLFLFFMLHLVSISQILGKELINQSISAP